MSILVTGGWSATVLGVSIVAHTLYTPVLAITVLATLRLAWWLSPRFEANAGIALRQYSRLGAISVVVGALCLSPWFFALGQHVQSGHMATPDIEWRSSPHGVDLATFVAPSPMHAVWGSTVRGGSNACIPRGSPNTPRRSR